MQSFESFGLLTSLLDTLKERELTTPTEIQLRAIPVLLEGKSLVGVAQTGSGKTLAYALPILHQLKTLENEKDPVTEEGHPRAVILVPTRELGEQVSKVFKPFTHTTRLRVRTVLGGTTFEVSRKSVAGCFEILIATPGRLMKLMSRSQVRFSDVRTLVFDEADQMLDPSFLPVATDIVAASPRKRQLALFSATVPKLVETLITNMFSDAIVIRSETSHRLVLTLKTVNKSIFDGRRFPVLEELLQDSVKGGTIIFANTRDQCDKLASEIEKSGRSCVVYRGEMDKVERRRNLKKFRDGEIDLLISTDLASRGLDVDHVGRVINYHLPQQMENYIHRVGRTARAGRAGVVINFVTERDAQIMAKVKSHDTSGAEMDMSDAPQFKKKPKITPVKPHTKITVKKRSERA